MSVIVEFSLPATSFELGEILSAEGEMSVSLETMVPIGNRSVPFFRTHGSARESFEADIRADPAVSGVHVVSTHDDETVYALDWESPTDGFLRLVDGLDGSVLEATGDAERWVFQLRLPTHEALSALQEECYEADIPLDIQRIYNPTVPEAGPWYGLTTPQREALQTATERGYYSLPRRTSTQELAEMFDLSDQAITERLRRGIETLVSNTLLLSPDAETD